MRLIWILLVYGIALFLENLTLIVGVSAIAVVVLPLRTLFVFVVLGGITTFFLSINLNYYLSRITLSLSSSNLSVLVFLSGWERAYLCFKDTLGFGIGFQQFGIVGKQGQIMEIIASLNVPGLNRLGGGNVAPKLVGEFGYFGMGLLLVYFAYFIKIFWWFNSLVRGVIVFQSHIQVFFHSCFLMYSIDLFVRGAGYFSAEGFMFVASIIWMQRWIWRTKQCR